MPRTRKRTAGTCCDSQNKRGHQTAEVPEPATPEQVDAPIQEVQGSEVENSDVNSSGPVSDTPGLTLIGLAAVSSQH